MNLNINHFAHPVFTMDYVYEEMSLGNFRPFRSLGKFQEFVGKLDSAEFQLWETRRAGDTVFFVVVNSSGLVAHCVSAPGAPITALEYAPN